MQELNQATSDFLLPQRQSPAAIIILMLRTALAIAKRFWPAILVVLLRAKKVEESNSFLIMLLSFAALTILFTFIRYWFYRFHMHENNLVIKTGWLKKKTITIPVSSIQSVHLEQNLWQQVFRVMKVSFDSAGSERVEARIDALAVKKAERLKHLILEQSHPAQVVAEVAEAPKEEVYKLSPIELLKLSFTANHIEAFLLLLALSLNLLDDFAKLFDLEEFAWLQQYEATIKEQMLAAITIVIVMVILLSVGVSVFRTVVRYFNFTMHSKQGSWRISYGLFSRHQRVIPHNKIQLFGWHANWLRRKANIWLVDVQTVGAVKMQNKQRIKIPLPSIEKVVLLASAYFQSAVIVPATGNGIEPAYWKRRTLVIALPVILLVTLIAAIWLGWHSSWIMLLVVHTAITHYVAYKKYRWFANDEGLQMHTGVWGRRFTLLTWKKVQQVKLSQTPYQRAKNLASVQFTTAGGRVNLPYIKLAEAQLLVNHVLLLVESNEQDWL